METREQNVNTDFQSNSTAPVSPLAGGRLRRHRVLLGAVAAVVLLAGVGVACVWATDLRLHFACVKAGVLYRSGQPSGSQLAAMVSRHNIRTVVNLRKADAIEKDKKARQEKDFAKAHGVRFVNIPYNDTDAGTQIPEFLALVADPANQPVLVHCAQGIERSGVMVAAFRMKTEGWSLARALDEMRRFGFKREKSPGMQKAVETFAATLSPSQAPAPPPTTP